MCVESATEIAKIMAIYERQYSLVIAATPVVHAVFTAALILVYATLSETNHERHVELSDYLSTLCNTLSELGHRYSNASRALDALLAVKRHWQGIMLVGTGRKRSSTTREPREAAAIRKKWKRHGFTTGILQSEVAGSSTTHDDINELPGACNVSGGDRERTTDGPGGGGTGFSSSFPGVTMSE